MNVCIDPYPPSHAISRIDYYLRLHAPRHIFITDEPSADIVVIFVTGRLHHRENRVDQIISGGKQVVLIQLALKSTRDPNPLSWVDTWRRAKFVWSYYDLSEYISNFYYAPLGVDTEIFYPMNIPKKYIICTTGEYYKDECLKEIWEAANITNGRVAHIGKRFESKDNVDFYQNICDTHLNLLYNQSSYISGLRRKEGFEMPVIEALQSGVVPIIFDTPNFRRWFDGFGLFIPEESQEIVVHNLSSILSGTPLFLSREQIDPITEKFDWKKIAEGFWRHCLD